MSNAWTWVGDCIHSFDEDGDSLLPFFRDVSDFAIVEEEAVSCIIKKSELAFIPSDVNTNMMYSIHSERDILIAYDFRKDVHHFFVNNGSQSQAASLSTH